MLPISEVEQSILCSIDQIVELKLDDAEKAMAPHPSTLAWQIPWTAAYQAPLSMGFARQEDWSGVPLPSPPLHPSHWQNANNPQINNCLTNEQIYKN